MKPQWIGVAMLLLAGCGLAKNGVGVAPRRAGADLSRYSQTRPSMGGLLTITIVAQEDRDAGVEASLEKAFAAVDAWEKLLSEWIPDSPVSRINAAAGKAPVVVPDEVLAAFKRAASVSHASHGAFDVSYAGMDRIWDFRPESEHRIPSEAERLAARAHVDWQKIRLDEKAHTVLLVDTAMKVSFGGIGQGIGADAAVESLKKDGFDDFVVDESGDTFFAGDAGGQPWKMAIQDPRGERGKTIATVAIRDGASETSGDYEKYFIGTDGIRYHHIMDPRTGAPARGFASVTVFAPDVTTADAYGTAIFAAGPAAGTDLLLARGLDGVLVTAPEDGPYVMTVTAGLKDRITITGFRGEVKWLAPKAH